MNRRGIGFILDKVNSISQIIQDESPQAQVDINADKNQSQGNISKILSSISKKSYRWFMSEYFYSFVDKPYF